MQTAFLLTDNALGDTNATMQTQPGLYNSHDPNWMDTWTVFYWGWWISWAPFVGMFIARISRG
jgi:choline-glycine betaine transporter